MREKRREDAMWLFFEKVMNVRGMDTRWTRVCWGRGLMVDLKR